MISSCNCTATADGNSAGARFQDATYGKGNRVFNPTGTNGEGQCTICGNKKTIGGRTVEVKSKGRKDAKPVIAEAEPKGGKK